MNEKKSVPVYLQIRKDGKIWVVLEDGTPLAHQSGVDTSSSATTGGVRAVITLQSAGWLPNEPEPEAVPRALIPEEYRDD
jgi:hypothetical protein